MNWIPLSFLVYESRVDCAFVLIKAQISNPLTYWELLSNHVFICTGLYGNHGNLHMLAMCGALHVCCSCPIESKTLQASFSHLLLRLPLESYQIITAQNHIYLFIPAMSSLSQQMNKHIRFGMLAEWPALCRQHLISTHGRLGHAWHADSGDILCRSTGSEYLCGLCRLFPLVSISITSRNQSRFIWTSHRFCPYTQTVFQTANTQYISLPIHHSSQQG